MRASMRSRHATALLALCFMVRKSTPNLVIAKIFYFNILLFLFIIAKNGIKINFKPKLILKISFKAKYMLIMLSGQ